MPNLSSLEQVAELPKLNLISVQDGNQQLCKKKFFLAFIVAYLGLPNFST